MSNTRWITSACTTALRVRLPVLRHRNEVISFLLHMGNYVEYKLTGRNIGRSFQLLFLFARLKGWKMEKPQHPIPTRTAEPRHHHKGTQQNILTLLKIRRVLKTCGCSGSVPSRQLLGRSLKGQNSRLADGIGT